MQNCLGNPYMPIDKTGIAIVLHSSSIAVLRLENI